jgi:hypothetical protein
MAQNPDILLRHNLLFVPLDIVSSFCQVGYTQLRRNILKIRLFSYSGTKEKWRYWIILVLYSIPGFEHRTLSQSNFTLQM